MFRNLIIFKPLCCNKCIVKADRVTLVLERFLQQMGNENVYFCVYT